MARTFGALTDSIARFQREATLRERLSALGRLSTVIAHEVRNPLMIIKGSLRTLKREDAAAEVREAAADIDHEVARLDRIVGDVLDFARPLRLERAPVDVHALARDAARAALEGADGVGARFALEPSAGTIVTDGERLRSVLVNLIANARESLLAAGRSSGEEIEVGARGLGRGGVVLWVADRGPGIPAGGPPARLRAVLHDEAHGDGPGPRDLPQGGGSARGSHPDREPRGRRHPGRVRAAGRGAGAHGGAMRSPHGSILLADDEEGILKTLGRALREDGHDVTATASASEAQRLLSERSFDVFVVDHRMPERTGLELIRDLAAAVPEGERPQVLMMTAHATVESAIEAMKLGALRLPAEALRGGRAARGRRAGRSSTRASAASTGTCSPSARRTSTTTASSAAAARSRSCCARSSSWRGRRAPC